ncbi:MAG: hypothetical protein DMF97_16185, partial [Acidobacteria bacterium]
MSRTRYEVGPDAAVLSLNVFIRRCRGPVQGQARLGQARLYELTSSLAMRDSAANGRVVRPPRLGRFAADRGS